MSGLKHKQTTVGIPLKYSITTDPKLQDYGHPKTILKKIIMRRLNPLPIPHMVILIEKVLSTSVF
jgi:hypothetical protein